jgi:hypothetical protein
LYGLLILQHSRRELVWLGVTARPSAHWIARQQSVLALIACGAEIALAHHYGTFQLTDEPIDAPLVALADALKVAGILPERFRALRPGQV